MLAGQVREANVFFFLFVECQIPRATPAFFVTVAGGPSGDVTSAWRVVAVSHSGASCVLQL
jgi:hypothetical protein